jgi:hypothetical protein
VQGKTGLYSLNFATLHYIYITWKTGRGKECCGVFTLPHGNVWECDDREKEKPGRGHFSGQRMMQSRDTARTARVRECTSSKPKKNVKILLRQTAVSRMERETENEDVLKGKSSRDGCLSHKKNKKVDEGTHKTADDDENLVLSE